MEAASTSFTSCPRVHFKQILNQENTSECVLQPAIVRYSGYKLQISVQANANGDIGVYVHLMKGPNDDQLIWPFCGDVVVELVNWIGDNDHHRYVIKLSSEVVTNNVCNRVLVGDRSAGRETHQFIQHSEIETEFHHHDCLYFRVKEVVVYSTELCLKHPAWQDSLSTFVQFTVTNISKEKAQYNIHTVQHSILTMEDINYVWKFRDHQISDISVFLLDY